MSDDSDRVIPWTALASSQSKTFVRQKLLLEAGFCGLTSKTSGLTIM